MTQGIRIHLPMQGTQVRSLVQKDSTCCRATKPVCCNDGACVPQPTQPLAPGALVALQREAIVIRSQGTTMKSSPPLAATRESLQAAKKTQGTKNKNKTNPSYSAHFSLPASTSLSVNSTPDIFWQTTLLPFSICEVNSTFSP